MSESKLPTDSAQYTDRVEPVNRKRQGEAIYIDKFTYTGVVHEFDAGEVFVDDAMTQQNGNTMFYRYPGKPPVMIDGDGVYARPGDSVEVAEEQAYFVLSQIAETGNVVGWRKK